MIEEKQIWQIWITSNVPQPGSMMCLCCIESEEEYNELIPKINKIIDDAQTNTDEEKNWFIEEEDGYKEE